MQSFDDWFEREYPEGSRQRCLPILRENMLTAWNAAKEQIVLESEMPVEYHDMEKSIRCLALELPEAVHKDVSTKWFALKTLLRIGKIQAAQSKSSPVQRTTNVSQKPETN